MKKLIPMLLALILAGCNDTKDNHELTASWMATHKKPIRAYKYKVDYTGAYYTLIDANSNVYFTGCTYFTFPPIIDSLK